MISRRLYIYYITKAEFLGFVVKIKHAYHNSKDPPKHKKVKEGILECAHTGGRGLIYDHLPRRHHRLVGVAEKVAVVLLVTASSS